MPTPATPPEIVNFGHNLRFRPAHYYEPRTEEEVLDILLRHARGTVRVVAARHSWSDAIVSQDALVCLRHFRGVETKVDERGDTWATVGGGCQIKHLLKELRRAGDITVPAIGLITEQTIAGAISTGTHGSGNHGLAHHISAVRLAAYDRATGEPRVFWIDSGPELLAARCSLGCLGIILSVRFRCRPEYHVGEINARYATSEAAFAHERDYPLQHALLVPHAWNFCVQHRRVVPPVERPLYRFDAWLYFAGWFLMIDVGLNFVFMLLARVLKSRGATRWFFRHVAPYVLLEDKVYIGRSDVVLTWEHELFRHLEMEVFVPEEHLHAATRFVAQVLQVADGATDDADAETAALLDGINLRDRLRGLRGTFTHHYPICIRRILRDDTLISMACGEDEAWYSLSFITLQEPRDAFYGLADFLAESMTRLFRARLHWGKYFPLDGAYARAAYPRLDEFAAVCRRYDPHGVFQNEFTRRVLSKATPAEVADDGPAEAARPREIRDGTRVAPVR